jgi:predicted pyridoxal phosphate-dependent acyltransferase
MGFEDSVAMFEQELIHLEKKHLLRKLAIMGSAQGPRVMVNGKSMLLMCSNTYLGLAEHPALREAACAAMERYGFGSGASRLVSGTSGLHEELERKIAEFKDTEAAILFNSGYAANTGIIPVVASAGDAILSDSLNHASIIDGCKLSKAAVHVYRHKDADHVESLLKKSMNARRRLIVTDGVFSMDGDIAPLPELVSLAEKYDALIMVDDAHATGVLGGRGRGTVEHFGLEGRVNIQMGTLGKALGSFGAYAAGTRDVIDYLVNTSRSFIYSTSLPPAVCAASLAALDIVRTDPILRNRLWNNRDRFVKGLESRGIDIAGSETPIVPVLIGDNGKTLKAADRIFELGLYATAIRTPTVPAGKARIRTTVMATHTEEDIDQAIEIFGTLKREAYIL